MKLLPSTLDSTLYGWEVLGIMLLAALAPAAAIVVWAVFFRKRSHNKGRRRRRSHSASNPATAITNGAPRSFDRENARGERNP